VHSLGVPLEEGATDSAWPHNPDKYLAYFPEAGTFLSIFLLTLLGTIWSFGSGYGGVSLLGSKWLGLQVATHDILTNKENWLAQHGAIVSVTSPKQETSYLLAVLPSGCGKSTLAFQVCQLQVDQSLTKKGTQARWLECPYRQRQHCLVVHRGRKIVRI
jgi:phosphoenolpyruvate carboxykinase (GTP)